MSHFIFFVTYTMLSFLPREKKQLANQISLVDTVFMTSIDATHQQTRNGNPLFMLQKKQLRVPCVLVSDKVRKKQFLPPAKFDCLIHIHSLAPKGGYGKIREQEGRREFDSSQLSYVGKL